MRRLHSAREAGRRGQHRQQNTFGEILRRIRRARPAPSAARRAISFWRKTARVSRRFATSAQAISSTSATAPSSSISTGRKLLRSAASMRVTCTDARASWKFPGGCAAAGITSSCACDKLTPGRNRATIVE